MNAPNQLDELMACRSGAERKPVAPCSIVIFGACEGVRLIIQHVAEPRPAPSVLVSPGRETAGLNGAKPRQRAVSGKSTSL